MTGSETLDGIPDLPKGLVELYAGEAREAVYFRKNIQLFNSSMAFSCIKVLTRILIREHQVWQLAARGNNSLQHEVRHQGSALVRKRRSLHSPQSRTVLN